MPKGIYLHKSGKKATGYINGNSFKEYYCKYCQKEISRFSAIYGSGLCKSCATKIRTQGKNNPNYGNHKLKGKFFGINSPVWKGGKPKCKDCGQELSHYHVKRCNSCNITFLHESGKINNKGRKNPMFGKTTHSKYMKYKKIYFHSSWEVKYAKYLDKQGIKWLYEPKTFDLENTTYTPDFYLPKKNLYIEIKGYWREDARKKYRLFKKLYSDIKIMIYNKKQLEKERII